MVKTGLTKTCSSCGLQKSLPAFLQLGGPEGTHYGNICADCRRANKDKIVAEKEPDETWATNTGHKVDSKVKVRTDTDKREQRNRIEERYFEEREKLFEKETVKKQKTQQATTDQRTREKLSQRTEKTPADKTNEQNLRGSPTEVAEREQKPDLTAPFVDTQIAGKLTRQGPIWQQFKDWLGNAPIAQKINKADNLKDKNITSSEYIEKKWGPSSRRK